MNLIIRAFSKLKELVLPKPPEIDKFLGSFDRLFEKQIEYILGVINTEIEKSREFGLTLRPADAENEKIAILTIFNTYGQQLNRLDKKEPNYSQQEYEENIRALNLMALELLKDEARYYFETTPPSETKTRYNCHLEGIMTRLAKDFMDRKCVFWMKK